MRQNQAEPRIPLSRQRLVESAVALADAGGIEALTMRKLASQLGFEVMALYNHVSNKHDLIDGMVDFVAAEMELPECEDWRAGLRGSALSAHTVLLKHRWVASLWARPMRSPARLRRMESMLACLREAGFSAEDTYRWYHALEMHIFGSTLLMLSLDFPSPEDTETAGESFFGETPPSEFPYLVEHLAMHRGDSPEAGGFEFVLDLLLDALEEAKGGN